MTATVLRASRGSAARTSPRCDTSYLRSLLHVLSHFTSGIVYTLSVLHRALRYCLLLACLRLDTGDVLLLSLALACWLVTVPAPIR